MLSVKGGMGGMLLLFWEEGGRRKGGKEGGGKGGCRRDKGGIGLMLSGNFNAMAKSR